MQKLPSVSPLVQKSFMFAIGIDDSGKGLMMAQDILGDNFGHQHRIGAELLPGWFLGDK